MSFQFLHIDTVARCPPKKATSKRWSLDDVLAEAGRVRGACPHVPVPKPAHRVLGVSLLAVKQGALMRADAARDARGRQLRKDAPVMLAGVASYPVRVAELDEAAMKDYERWEARVVAWLDRRFGVRLASVVRHSDEAFPHLHFFIVPDMPQGGHLDLGSIHPGIAAREAAKAAGLGSKESNRAYCDAMRRLQSDFYENVGVFHGHLRRGPGRRRLSRADYLAEKDEATRRKQAMDKMGTEMDALKGAADRSKILEARADKLATRADLLQQDNVVLVQLVDELRADLTQTKERHEALRVTLRETAKATVALVGFLISGASRYRSVLLAMERPRSISEVMWSELLWFLGRRGNHPTARERNRVFRDQ